MNVRQPTLRHLVVVVCLFSSLAFAQVSPESGPERPAVVAQRQPQAIAMAQSRADEWKRREILESQHGRSPFEMNSIGYLEMIVIPLLVFILILGVVRMQDF